MTYRMRTLMATVALAGTLLVNALANALPINGLNTGEVSDLYPSLFTPAGLTFLIWSVIYVLLTGFIIFTWVKKHNPVAHDILPWFIISCLLNITWILVWHHLMPGIALLIIVLFTGVLTKIFLRLAAHVPSEGWAERVLVYLPFTLYFAWLCVATIANASAFLVSISWDSEIDAQTWTIIMMVVAGLLGVVITIRYHVPAYAVVVIWALAGIMIRWKDSDYHGIITAAWIISLTLAGAIVYTIARRKTMFR